MGLSQSCHERFVAQIFFRIEKPQLAYIQDIVLQKVTIQFLPQNVAFSGLHPYLHGVTLMR